MTSFIRTPGENGIEPLHSESQQVTKSGENAGIRMLMEKAVSPCNKRSTSFWRHSFDTGSYVTFVDFAAMVGCVRLLEVCHTVCHAS